MIKSILTAAALALCVAGAHAAAELPTATVNGRVYYYYDVKSGDNIFTVSNELGISREAIIESNPGVADGMTAGTRLYFPAPAEASKPNTASWRTADMVHEVKKGETIYDIAHRYGVSVDRIRHLNPLVNNGLREGQKLVIERKASDDAPLAQHEAEAKTSPAKESATIAEAQAPAADAAALPAADVKVEKSPEQPPLGPVVSFTTHTVKGDETLYGIAKKYGVSENDIIAANPGINLDRPHKGLIINIPAGANGMSVPERPVVGIDNGAVTIPALTGADEVAGSEGQNSDAAPYPGCLGADEVEPEREAYTIAVLLPLMLNEEKPSRQAELFTDFYRGFLLGAETLKDAGTDIDIIAYDTSANIDSLNAILSRPEIADVDLFIGTSTDELLTALADKASADSAYVLNLFVPRNEAQTVNHFVIQGNIPRDMMYDRAIDAFIELYADATPVFLSRVEGNGDKADFVERLQERLKAEGRGYEEVAFKGVLTATDLKKLSDEQSYVFVPISSQRTEFAKIVPGLKNFKAEQVYPAETFMYGYPEWLTFRGDLIDNLKALNTTVYTRFYNDLSQYPGMRVDERFKELYGAPMIDAIPSQGMLGYDTAIFVIKALRSNGGDFHSSTPQYEGNQTDFILDGEGIEGLVNKSLKLVKFADSGIVTSNI